MPGQITRGLGGVAGLGETALTRSDDDALRIDARGLFPDGLNVFGTLYSGDQIWVNTNGTLSFGAALRAYPTAANLLPAQDVIAPFWADVDTRIDGEGAESGQIWIDQDTTTGTLTITWQDVGSYRRQADDTNLFQVQITDQGGGDFDITFRYERIDWVSGSAEGDAGAQVFLGGLRVPQAIFAGGDPATLDTRPGNTGHPGLWSYEMRGGALPGATPVSGLTPVGDEGGNVLTGGSLDDLLRGRGGPDVLRGNDGNDWLYGGDGGDTLNGGAGDDFIFGGTTEADLRDVVYAGDGNDNVDGGYGNDLIYGGAGNDTIAGGFGVDELIGQDGDDVITGSAWSDLIFGGAGSDFLNGGFGFDRINGGAGADRFYHLGIADHGSDWVQDYNAAEGDLLVWGGGNVSPSQFQINWADTANAGVNGVSEAFVIYRPTGQILWALVDGEAQSEINLRIGGDVFDLLS